MGNSILLFFKYSCGIDRKSIILHSKDRRLNKLNKLLLRIQTKKLSYEPWFDDKDLILLIVAFKLVYANFYGRSFMYWIVKSSAFSNWNVYEPNLTIPPIWKSVSTMYLPSIVCFFLYMNFPPQTPEFLSAFWYTWMVSSPQ